MLFSSETKTSQHKQVSVRGKERTHFKGFSGNVEEEHWRGASALKCSEHGEVKGVVHITDVTVHAFLQLL